MNDKYFRLFHQNLSNRSCTSQTNECAVMHTIPSVMLDWDLTSKN